MSQLEPAVVPADNVVPVDDLLTALEASTDPREVRMIADRVEALLEVAKRARVSDEQLRAYAVASLRVQRRGGELLLTVPRAKSGVHAGSLPTISDLLGVPHNLARHVAENWLAVAKVPEHLFDDYVAREGVLPSRGGLLRFRQQRPRHPPPPPPTPLRPVPDSSTRSRAAHPANGRPLPDPDDDMTTATVQTRRPGGYVLVDVLGQAWMIGDGGRWIAADSVHVLAAIEALQRVARAR